MWTNKKKYDVTKWNPLSALTDYFSVADLVDTIERDGLYVWDRHGRVVVAYPESDDMYSQRRALDCLADVYAAQMDPGPPGDDEFDRSDEDPLNQFGWPKEHFPEIKRTQPSVITLDKSKSWEELAREIAEELYTKNKARTGSKGRLEDYASQIEQIFITHSIKGAHGKVISKNYIQRDALQGDHWWAKKR